MKLHLGCGQIYLEGYLNIDFPMTEHSVQTESKADELADITKLRYKKESVEEVRLHHVFEHFPRAVACGLLVSWRSWLTDSGRVTIEVPDFDRTARAVLSPIKSKRAKLVGLRHIFGSQEAGWAVHYEGWMPARMKYLLNLLEFEEIEITKNSWRNTYNFTVSAAKNPLSLTKNKARDKVTEYLCEYLVDNSESEQRLLKTWLEDYDNQIKQSYAK